MLILRLWLMWVYCISIKSVDDLSLHYQFKLSRDQFLLAVSCSFLFSSETLAWMGRKFNISSRWRTTVMFFSPLFEASTYLVEAPRFSYGPFFWNVALHSRSNLHNRRNEQYTWTFHDIRDYSVYPIFPKTYMDCCFIVKRCCNLCNQK